MSPPVQALLSVVSHSKVTEQAVSLPRGRGIRCWSVQYVEELHITWVRRLGPGESLWPLHLRSLPAVPLVEELQEGHEGGEGKCHFPSGRCGCRQVQVQAKVNRALSNKDEIPVGFRPGCCGLSVALAVAVSLLDVGPCCCST